ncbi:uncharacterized protein BX663DRAFT_215482 [Cokeromyces recurvatus]|uniref:uncharacterized protein n=1 Tax=Cokeromyces recurvatus TaxID=90255 RepID=UPI00221E8041|nr:uncharacterized protein BX663DRAFT_215482 [Cokeromyces recurvatus]KAI7899213.1 hypothetical protein BX663DRAFT_215482 [Cokeromyces recurvatus]
MIENYSKKKIRQIQDKKEEQAEMRRTLRLMKFNHRRSVINTTDIVDEEIRKLEKEIIEEREKIADYESLLENNTSNDRSDTLNIRDISIGFKARIDKLLYDSNIDESPSTETKEKQEQSARDVYKKLLDFIIQHNNDDSRPTVVNLEIFNELFPDNKEINTNFFKVNEEANVLTTILLQLYSNNNMTLMDLTEFIQNYAKQHHFSEEEAVQSIYKLVGLDLLVIDRTQNDSICTLKFK